MKEIYVGFLIVNKMQQILKCFTWALILAQISYF